MIPSVINPEQVMRAHQYLYYVKCRPVLSDYAYDTFCKVNGLNGGGGSDRDCDYTDADRDLASALSGK